MSDTSYMGIAQDMNAQLVQTLYRQSTLSMPINLIVGAVLVSLLWHDVAHESLLVWYGVLWAIVLARLIQLLLYFKRGSLTLSTSVWAYSAAIVAGLLGLVWGVAAVLFIDGSSLLNILTVTLVISGMASGSIVALSAFKPSLYAMVIPAMTGLIVSFATTEVLSSYALILLLILALLGYLMVGRNAHRLQTESVRLGFENLALRREAEEASAAKTRFLAAASHDLRQPIHALGLLISALNRKAISEQNRATMDQIDTALASVNSMLLELLDVSQLDAGILSPQLQPTNLEALLSSTLGTHTALAIRSGNQLKVRQRCLWVMTDAGMLERIISNLTTNALTYTNHGKILIGARRRGDSVVIEVWDNGMGIPADQIEKIFTEFHQLDNPQRDRNGGLGLGLAIVSRLGKLLNHRIDVSSVPGQGSCFRVSLPSCELPCHTLATAHTQPLPTQVLVGLRVLILDDDTMVCDAMQTLLHRWQCQSMGYSDLKEAIAAISNHPIDILLVDYRLPGNVTGIEAIEQLRDSAGTPIPAIIITGDTAPERLREALSTGFPLLHKPVKPGKLRSALRHSLEDGNSHPMEIDS